MSLRKLFNQHLCLLCIFLSLAAISPALQATEAPLIQDARFRSLSTQDGLSQDTIHDLQFDDKGFLYIATENGLDRWDGYHIREITGANDELRETSVFALYYLNKKLLIGTAFKGVYIYNTETGEIETNIRQTYPHMPNFNQYVNGFAQLNASTMLLLFDGSIVAYDLLTKEKQTFYSLPKHQLEDGHGIRWIMPFMDYILMGGTTGLFASDENGKAVELKFLSEEIDDPDALNVKHLFLDNNNRVWISTVQGLHYVDANTLKNAIENQQYLNTTKILPHRNIWRVTEDGNGTLWLGTDRGLYRANSNLEGVQTQFLFEPKRGYEVLSKKDIKDVVVDAHGDLWMGTDTSGALHWSPLSEYFVTLRNRSTSLHQQNTLTHNGIWAIAEASKNTVWVGTENGINTWNTVTNETQGWLKKETVIGYSDTFIDRIFVQPDDSVILATGDGFWCFDVNTAKQSRLLTSSPITASVLNGYIFGANSDSKGRIWFANDEGYFVYQQNQDSLVQLPLNDKINTAFFSGFLGISEKLNNQMVMSVAGSTWLLNPNTYEATKIHAIGKDDNALDVSPSGYVIDNQNIMWVGYPGYGLIGIDATSYEQKFHFDRTTSLGTDIVYSVQLDEFGYIWMTSQKGLHRLDLDRNSFEHFTYGDPLAISEFNESADAQLSDGRLAFGSPSGLLVFDPQKINAKLLERSNSHALHTGMTITEFSSANLPKSTPISSLNNSSILLNHDDKGIKISFSNMEFSGSAGKMFSYQLFNDNQIISEQTTQEATVDIPYLEAGEYTFKVFEKQSIAGPNTNGASLNISVAHAPWSSPFAYTVYVVILCCALASFMLMRKRQLLALNAAKLESSMFGEAFKQTRDCVVLLDADKRAFAANKAFQNVFGINNETQLAESWERLLATHFNLAERVTIQLASLDENKLSSTELHLELAPDDVHDFLIKASIVDGKHFGEASLFMLIFADISEQKETQRKLTQMATHDTLTGLANRQLLMDRLEHAVKHCQEHNRQLAVMFIDLDRFKAINDSLGHNMGDALLTEISRRMRKNCPPDMTLARVGGDEFVAVAEDIEAIESVTKFARQLIDIIEQPVIAGGETLRVSCSVGASIFPHDAVTPDLLLRFADMAMYSAKKDPITPFCFYTRTLNEAAHERLQMENLVKAAFDQKSFYNVYQPIVNVTRGNTVGFELLMRCNIEGVFLSPTEFIPVLEQLRLIVDVTKVAVADAVEELATWYAKGFNGYVSVNLSALHFTDDIDIDFFIQCLNKYSLPKTALRFEVTENVLMNDKEQALDQFNRLKEAGFKLALDDFGTGYSSLGYLRTFPLDVIKIDKSFCDGIDQSERGNGLVETTINMSKGLSMSCIAEGVETAQQVSFLMANGCYLHQGYHFSAPVKAQEAAKLALKDWL